MQKLVLATSNAGKLKEIQAILAIPGLEIIPQSEFGVIDADETGLTLVENAIIKARHACTVIGLPALADDTGLCVQHLNGKPGVYSARYAGELRNTERNVEKLLKELQGVPEAQRQASFYCAIVLMRHSDDPVPLIFEGQWDGSILTARTGEHGFGYDSVFYVKEFQKSAAELEPAVKNTVSHRAKALQKLRDYFYAKSELDKLD